MKKLLILAACTTMLTTAAEAQLTFAPEIGLNLANMRGKDTGLSGGLETMKNKLKLGVKAGVNLNIPVGDRVVIQPGLFYSIKGYKSDNSYAESDMGITYNATEKHNVTLHYFEIPVNIQYMFNDPSEGRFFVGVGGYIGLAFSGHDKATAEYSQTGGGTNFSYAIDTSAKLTFGDDPDHRPWELGRVDAGVSVNAGYLLRSGIFFRGMYQIGLDNLMPGGDSDHYLKTSNITISVGYMLGNHPASKGPRMKGSEPL
jgi:hypothetical protein